MKNTICNISAACALAIVLIIMKWLYEDFGILKITGKKAKTLHVMEMFPNERGVVLVHRLFVELFAICFAVSVIAFIFIDSWQAFAGVSATAFATTVMYSSYRNTRNFFLTLEKEIIRYLKDKREGDDIDEENT